MNQKSEIFIDKHLFFVIRISKIVNILSIKIFKTKNKLRRF